MKSNFEKDNTAIAQKQGEHIAGSREWLYWYDANGDRYPTAEERAIKAEAIANQERLAKQEAEQKALRLAEKLRAMGINPDEL